MGTPSGPLRRPLLPKCKGADQEEQDDNDDARQRENDVVVLAGDSPIIGPVFFVERMTRYAGPQPEDPKPVGGGSYNREEVGQRLKSIESGCD